MTRTHSRLVLLLTLALPLASLGCPPRPAANTAPRPRPDRLAGDWEVHSTLYFKDGLAGVQGQLLRLSTRLRRILDGRLELPGLPPFLARLAAPLVKQFLTKHVPPWAREAVTNLARLHAMIGETSVVSLETLRSQGDHRYRGHSRWTRVTIRAGATKVTVKADRIPGLGELRPAPYDAEDRDGRLHVRGLLIESRFAYLFRWAVEALLTAATCSGSSIPCFKTLDQVADHFLDCPKLAERLLRLAPALRAVKAVLVSACAAQKKQLLTDARTELNKLALVLTYAHLSGEATIAPGPKGLTLRDGRWFGRLGKAYGQGRFRGTFTGRFLRK